MAKWVRKKAAEEMAAMLSKDQSVIVVDPNKLRGRQAVDLRRSLQEVGARMRVVKNSVGQRALEQAGRKELAGKLERMNALVWARDPVVALKRLNEFKEKHNILEVKRASVDGILFEGEKLKQLAALPPREQLLASVVGTVQAPLANFVGVLSTLVSQIAGILNAIGEKKKGS